MPEYTPPELHDKSFANIDRTTDHDNFGLAVLVFHLLMMGRHPFSGVPPINADIPINKAIQGGYYAYSRSPTKLKPPPNVPPIAMLDAAILDLFEQAFRSPKRPTAADWWAALDATMRRLQLCKNDTRHSYPSSAGDCPWCRMIAVARVMFFLPGQGPGTHFRPEDIDQLLRKLAGMQFVISHYMRPKPVLPIPIALPPGLRSVKKAAPALHPPAPPRLQEPALVPLPSPPDLLLKPPLRPIPPDPVRVQPPPLAPLPDAPPAAPKPAMKPLPIPQTIVKPTPIPFPPNPKEPPYPELRKLLWPKVYPPKPTLGPHDPFLEELCIVGSMAGLPVLLIAWPVGIIIIIVFGAWRFLLKTTKEGRRARAEKAIKLVHDLECARIDDEHEDLALQLEEANQLLIEAWQAKRSALGAEHQRLCLRIDDENRRELAAWEEADAIQRAKFEEERRTTDIMNQELLAHWEAVDSVRRAEHARVCAPIEAANAATLAEWQAKNAEIRAGYLQLRGEIEWENAYALTTWDAENASLATAYKRSYREAEEENQRRKSAWRARKAAIQTKHDRECREVDAENRRRVELWKAQNAPWIAERKRWQDRATAAEAEIRRLEAELHSQRAETESRFQLRKKEAEGTATSHNRARQDYEAELKQAEVNSKQIQLEEHLDRSLIRKAKLKGITSDRILSLESFGIETANDVQQLTHQKVPGIGPVLTKRLLDWRDGLAAKFQPKLTLPDSEKNRIANRYAPIMLPVGQSLQRAINELEIITTSHRDRETETLKAIAERVQNLAIAEAHVRAMKVSS